MLRHDNATHLPRARGGLERRIRDAETHLFDAVGADVDQFFLDLARTRLRLRVIAHGRGPTVLLLHGVSESAAVWAPLFPKLRHLRVLAVDLPGHGLSDPISFQPGKVRQTARSIVDDILDALQIDHVPVIGHSLGGMFALWHLAAGSTRISELVAIGAPAVALKGTRVRIPLSLLTVRGLGVAVLRAPSPPGVYRRLLARGLGTSDVAAAPGPLIEALRLSARRPDNARTVASLMHGMNRFRRARPESVLSRPELASIRTPTTFILGRDDPYLTVSGARRSVDQIRGGRLLEMPGGHAPWLADPEGAAKLIIGHPRREMHNPPPVPKPRSTDQPGRSVASQ